MSRNIIKPYKLLSAQSLAADFESEPTVIETIDNFAYLIESTGVTDNTGTFGVEIRFKKANTSVATRWVPLTLTTVPTIAGVDFEEYVYLTDLIATEARLTFTAAGGTPDGVADVWIMGKTTGG